MDAAAAVYYSYPQASRLLDGTVERVKAKLGSTQMHLAHQIDDCDCFCRAFLWLD
jgi:hypothetical protein